MFRYVDEQVFRFNNRKDGDYKLTDADRFARAMSQVAGRRLTYAELTGKERIAAPRADRDGGSGRPLLVLVGRFSFLRGSF